MKWINVNDTTINLDQIAYVKSFSYGMVRIMFSTDLFLELTGDDAIEFLELFDKATNE